MPGPQAVIGLTDWNAGTGDEPLFGDVTPGGASGGQGPVAGVGDVTPGGASGGQGPVAGVGDVFAVNTDTPGPQAVTPGLTDWNAGTGDEPLFGDVTPGGASGGQGIDPAAPPGLRPAGQWSTSAASMGPATSTPGVTDWNAGTGDEPLFGDLAPGDATGGQGLANPTDR